jgi:amino acid adenylation domain-containing protein
MTAVHTVHEAFRDQARRTPSAPAVVGPDLQLSYGDLRARADALAAGLRRVGVGPGDTVGLAMTRSADLVASMVGVLQVGAAYVPLDPAQPTDRLAFICDDTGVALVVADAPAAERVARTGRPVARGADLAAGSPDRDGPGIVSHPGTGESLAYVMFTSGSTGKPKGVAVSHRNILHLVAGLSFIDLSAGARVLQFSNVGFDAATFEIWGPLLNGGAVVMPAPGVNALDLPDEIKRYGVNTLFLTTALFNELVEVNPDILGAVPQVLFGGEAVSVPRVVRYLRARVPQARLVHCYGPTETTTFATAGVVVSEPPDGGTVPIGTAVGGTRLLVLDDDLTEVDDGVEGQLYIGGDGVSLGYLNRPGLTAQRFVPDPTPGVSGSRLYRTGDEVRRVPGGALEFSGRLDRQVKVRGFRIEPAEVELCIRAAPCVRDAVVVTRPDAAGSARLVAYVSSTDGTPPVVEDLRAHLLRRLPEYMLPTQFVAIDRLPLTATGKVDHAALPDPAENRPNVAAGYRAPGTPTERALVEIWCDVLELPEIGVDDNFFALGGDSIRSIGVIAQAEERGLVVSLIDVFTRQTIAELARALDTLAR